MTEEQLAQLLDEYLDAFLAGEPLPDDLPAEVAELLNVALDLTETAPAPRPEFGEALKESLLESPGTAESETSDDAGTALDPGFGGMTLSPPVIAGLVITAGLALLAGLVFLAVVASNLWQEPEPTAVPSPARILVTPAATNPPTSLPEPTSQPTRTRMLPTAAPSQPDPASATPSPAGSPATAPDAAGPTPTPIIDILPQVTVSVEVRTDPPSLVPGSGGGSSGSDRDDDGGGSGSGGGGGSNGGGDDDDD